jgi:hypothetical protein
MNENIQVEVTPNDGTIPTETPTEEVTPTETIQQEEVPETKVEETTEQLVELPDGRKVNAQQAVQEYTNLLSDYTRKSQELATIKGGNKEIINKETPAPTDEWIPQTWEEVLAKAEETILNKMNSKAEAEAQHNQEIISTVQSQIEEIKKIDPKLNDIALFSHATKYGFTDLVKAHSNMKDMHKTIDKVREDTVKNITKRNAEPINGSTNSGTVIDADVYQPTHGSALDYLHSLK